MSTFTISPDYFRDFHDEYLVNKFLRDFFVSFFLPTPHKIALDEQGYVISVYRSFIDVESQILYKDLIKGWLDYLGNTSFFEPITCDILSPSNEEDKFLTLCSSTKGERHYVTSSKQHISYFVDSQNYIHYNDELFPVLDRDEIGVFIRKTVPHPNNTTTNNYNLNGSTFVGGNMTNSQNQK